MRYTLIVRERRTGKVRNQSQFTKPRYAGLAFLATITIAQPKYDVELLDADGQFIARRVSKNANQRLS